MTNWRRNYTFHSFYQFLFNIILVLGNCTCETSSVLINASIYGDPAHITTEINCPVYNECCKDMLESLNFWLEGVVQVMIANIGIVVNTAFCFILGSKEMRNSFNSLLISLAIFDNGYLLASILESFRKCFKLVRYYILWYHFNFCNQFLSIWLISFRCKSNLFSGN